MDKMEFIKQESSRQSKIGEINPEEYGKQSLPSSPISESLEQLEKEVDRMHEYFLELFSKLKPCLNENRLQEGHKNKKESEPTSPKSAIRERITSITTTVKKSTEDIAITIDSLEL